MSTGSLSLVLVLVFAGLYHGSSGVLRDLLVRAGDVEKADIEEKDVIVVSLRSTEDLLHSITCCKIKDIFTILQKLIEHILVQ